MKRTLSILFAVLALTLTVSAQDARQRTASTIVEDVLAQMPAQAYDAFTSDMLDLAKAAPQSVEILAGMLQSADKGANNRIEYAINGLTNFAATPGNQIFQTAIKKGFESAIAKCTDPTNKQFLESQLRLLGKAENTAPAEPVDAVALLARAKALAQSAKSNDRCEALYLTNKVLGSLDDKTVLKALKDNDHRYRMTALGYADATDELGAKIAKKFKSFSDGAKTDVLNWLGDHKLASQSPIIADAISSANSDIAKAAIEAAGKIGGDQFADALINCLGGANDGAALKALRSFPGKLNGKVKDALKTATGDKLNSLLKLASLKGMKNCAEEIYAKAKEGIPAALDALANVVTPNDVPALTKLLDNAGSEAAPKYENALQSALSTLSPAEKYDNIKSFFNQAANKERLFTALATSGTDQAVEDLTNAFKAGSQPALKALCKTDNYKAAPTLLEAGKAGSTEALASYIGLVNKYVTDADKKCEALCKAIEATADKNIINSTLSSLKTAPTAKAFTVASSYLDDKATAITAADAVKTIAVKCLDDIDVNAKKEALNKAIAAYQARGNADDGYAVDEIKKILAGTAEGSPIFTLSDEEKKAGFEMLFDGTNLDKWTGNVDGYRISNNEIYVTAGYGDGGNLYTEKEYRDFIFRFEFSFVRPGANNGIGVRTPHGVDAAYGGMCEVQVLDHDDPIYKNLREYQVHGSVYGVIPAKRIVHKPLGEWSQEEIKVKGNHITVTVNGEVIVDGDIKEACQGHNVAPDGGNENPYTVDHRNHPGMFNETGYIGFLGHGPGVKFRNVRVLDLSPKAKKTVKK